MNKITGAKELTEQDVKTIQELTGKNISDEAVSHITGWSKIVVSRIRRGVYYEGKKQLAERRQRIKEQKNQEAQAPSPTPEIGQIVALLIDISARLTALCKAWGCEQQEET